MTATLEPAVTEAPPKPLFTPTPMQRIFILCPADEVVYGGAAGGGKSESLLMLGIMLCVGMPGSRVVYIRTTYPELEEMIDRSKQVMPVAEEGAKPVAKYNESKHRWVFRPARNPYETDDKLRSSTLTFSHLADENAVFQWQGKETDLFLIDEATLLPAKSLERLGLWNRSGVPGGWARLLMGTNPGNIAHEYVRTGWVNPPDDDVELIAFWDETQTGPDGLPGNWRRYKEGTTGHPEPFVVWRPKPSDAMKASNAERAKDGLPPDVARSRCFIPARVGDNPHVDRTYRANLLSIKDEKLRKALYEGSWDIFEGQAFPEYDEKIHVVSDIDVSGFRKWRSVDWGWVDPTASYWYAYDPEKEQVITYRELYVREVDDRDLCEMIRMKTPQYEWIDMTVADPSMFSGGSNEYGLSRADIWNKYGVPLTRAINKREAGFARVKQMLSINPRTKEPYWVITKDCYNLRRTLPTLSYALNGKEDIEERGAEDHSFDSCFVAGTLVHTLEGHTPIEDIMPLDFVFTRVGWRLVTHVGRTGLRQIITVLFTNGVRLRGTGDHPVWVEGQGFVRLDSLQYGDTILSYEEARDAFERSLPSHAEQWKPHHIQGVHTTDTQMLKTQTSTSVLAPSSLERKATFTAASGWMRLARSLRDATSTTKTQTLPTTTSTTSNASLPGNTRMFTLRTQIVWRPHERRLSGYAHLRLPGTGQKRAENGIVSTLLRRLRNWCGVVQSATTVGLNTRPQRTQAASVPTPVNQPLDAQAESMISRSSAPNAGQHSARTVTGELNAVRVRVVSVTESYAEPVYNLEVEDQPEYFANGVLVHNCRYGLLATPAFFGNPRGPLKPAVYRIA